MYIAPLDVGPAVIGGAGADVGAACSGPMAARPMVDYRVHWVGVALKDGVGWPERLGYEILEGN